MSNQSKINKSFLEELAFNHVEIEYALNFFEQLKSDGVLLSNSFYDDIWSFSHEYSPGRIIRLDFEKIKITLSKEENLLIKLWMVSLLEKHKPSTCTNYLHYFSIAINETNNFSLEELDYFIEWLHQKHLTDNEKIYLFSNVFDYFEFTEHVNASKYLPRLYEVRKKIKFRKNSSILPSSKYILTFSYYLEKYFIDIDKNPLLSKQQIYEKKILFSPILIWWKLTTIIPMRSTEFCIIKRNCLSVKQNRYYITIDRIKRKSSKANSFDYYTNLEINEEMYLIINNYIKLTDPFGHSDTLISYASLINVDYSQNRLMQKKNLKSFNMNNFEKLLIRFYKEVIKEFYGIEIAIHQRLSSNDTRHIAFVSLMMQGISPVEIARIGGHQTIAAQYHYSFHTEYWIDNEVFKLINNFKNTSSKNNEMNHIPDKIKLKAFEKSDSPHKFPLSIGYCTDPLVRCEAKDCMLCSHWGVEINELVTKQHLIISKIKKSHNKIDELMNFIYNIQTHTTLKTSSSDYLKNEEKIESTFIKLESELKTLARLTQIKKETL